MNESPTVPCPSGGAHRDGLPYTVLSCCISLDGYIGSATGDRLLLSNAQDFARVDAVRASCDAILVGAETIRRDNPRLLVRSHEHTEARQARGKPPTPVKVAVTAAGSLDCQAAFFSSGGERLVYCPSDAVPAIQQSLGERATVVDGGAAVSMRAISTDLFERGIRRLMVEGGATVHTQFLVEDIVDELHLAVAPIFVGDRRARPFVDDGSFPWHPPQRGQLAEVRQIGDVALLTYALSERFDAHQSGGTQP